MNRWVITICGTVYEKNRLDELTDFYRHLNGVVETIIDKFGTMERVTTKFMKTSQPPMSANNSMPYTPMTPVRSIHPNEIMTQLSATRNAELM